MSEGRSTKNVTLKIISTTMTQAETMFFLEEMEITEVEEMSTCEVDCAITMTEDMVIKGNTTTETV